MDREQIDPTPTYAMDVVPKLVTPLLISLSYFTGKLYGDVPFIEERHRHRYEVCLSR